MILHKLCQIPKSSQKKVAFGFSDGSRNFRKLLSVSCEVRVFARVWLYQMSGSKSLIFSRFTSSAVIKSPKFSARSTASPVRFLQRALVTLVLLRTSQFRSFWKWVEETMFLRWSESGSREVPAGVHRDADIPHWILCEVLQPIWEIAQLCPCTGSVSLQSAVHFLESRNWSPNTGPSVRRRRVVDGLDVDSSVSCVTDARDVLAENRSIIMGLRSIQSFLCCIGFSALLQSVFWPRAQSWEYPWSSQSFPLR